jgi:hypothetical protein
MPMPPAFETAATSFGRLMKAIPASMMGCLIPKSSVILVFMVSSLETSFATMSFYMISEEFFQSAMRRG